MRRSHLAVLLPLLTLCSAVPSVAVAQRDPIVLQTGHVARLRLSSDTTAAITGIVQRITGDSVFVRVISGTPAGATPMHGYLLRDVSRVDVRVGHSNGIGAAIGGAFLGLATAFAVDRLTDRHVSEKGEICFIGCTDHVFRRTESRMPGVFYPIAAGAFGALFYSRYRGDRWAAGMFITPPMPVSGRSIAPVRLGGRWTF